MYGKVMFAAGLAVGYVFGTRKGRQGYLSLKRQAEDIWRSDRVQGVVSDAQQLAKDKIPVVGEKLSDAVDKVKPSQAAGSTGDSATADI